MTSSRAGGSKIKHPLDADMKRTHRNRKAQMVRPEGDKNRKSYVVKREAENAYNDLRPRDLRFAGFISCGAEEEPETRPNPGIKEG
jgi:hypothetical protein